MKNQLRKEFVDADIQLLIEEGILTSRLGIKKRDPILRFVVAKFLKEFAAKVREDKEKRERASRREVVVATEGN